MCRVRDWSVIVARSLGEDIMARLQWVEGGTTLTCKVKVVAPNSKPRRNTQHAYAIRSTQSLSRADTISEIRNTHTQYTTLVTYPSCILQIHNTQYAYRVTDPSRIADTQYTVRRSGHRPFMHCRYAIRSTQISGHGRITGTAWRSQYTHLCLSIRAPQR